MFFVTGMSFIIPKLGETLSIAFGGLFDAMPPRSLVLILCAPVVVMGAACFWQVRSFARTWPAVLCAAIAWVGLLYGTGREDHRGWVNATYMTAILPAAALIVKHRCWWLCVRSHVMGNAFALGLVVWFEWQAGKLFTLGALHRFGNLRSVDDSTRLGDPNVMGGQLALAAVLAFVLYLRSGTATKTADGKTVRARHFGLGWTIALSLACLLTASRGAFVAWGGGMMLAMFSARRREKTKLADLVAMAGVLILSTVFVVAAIDFKPWQTLESRLDGYAVRSASGRLPLWQGAFDAWRSNPQHFFIGAGAGLAPTALGAQMGYVKSDGVSIATVDCHNSFIEWGLNFGLVGMIAGLWLVVGAAIRARRFDRRDRTLNRQTILICYALAAMTFVTVFQLSFLAAGALILAMVSDSPPATKAAARQSSCQSSHLAPRDVPSSCGARRPQFHGAHG